MRTHVFILSPIAITLAFMVKIEGNLFLPEDFDHKTQHTAVTVGNPMDEGAMERAVLLPEREVFRSAAGRSP